jgi:hypothetical protein
VDIHIFCREKLTLVCNLYFFAIWPMKRDQVAGWRTQPDVSSQSSRVEGEKKRSVIKKKVKDEPKGRAVARQVAEGEVASRGNNAKTATTLRLF